MSIESAAKIVALEALLAGQEADDGTDIQAAPSAQSEHPLTRELRTMLSNPEAHRIGDLARVLDTVLKEMAMFKGATASLGETGT
jgi:hypothetical protein